MSLMRLYTRHVQNRRSTSFVSARRWSSFPNQRNVKVGSNNAIESARKYCSDLLLKYDTPSYTQLAFIPPASQKAYLAIRALNIEIARVADTVSTPHAGSLRLNFWKDNISKALNGNPPKHPVPILITAALDELDARTNGASAFSKNWFMRIITAREQYLDNNPYINMTSLESYAENTYSTLMYLTLQSYPMASVTADHVASHIGKAAGISAVLRGLPLLAFPPPPNHHSNASFASAVEQQRSRSQQGFVNLPLDVMAEMGLREEDVLRQGASAEGLKDAVFKVATRASDHLITARTMLQDLRRGHEVSHAFEHGEEAEHQYHESTNSSIMTSEQYEEVKLAFGVFMPAVSTSLWLSRLQKVDFDIFHESLRKREWILPWKAYLAFQRKEF